MAQKNEGSFVTKIADKLILPLIVAVAATVVGTFLVSRLPILNSGPTLVPTVDEIIILPDITDTPLVEKQITPATNTPVPPTWEPPTPTAVPTISRAACAVNQNVFGLQVEEKQYYPPSMHWLDRPTRNTATVGVYTANGYEEEKYEIDLLALTDGWWTFVYEFGNTGFGFVICSGGNGVFWGVDYKSRYSQPK